MTDAPTRMRREIDEIPQAVERLLTEGAGAVAAIAAEVRARDVAFLVSVARGSSDHACTFLKYASELMLGLPMASVGPSVASIYGAELRLAPALCLAVSQSGQSPDIVRMTGMAARAGALTVAITNDAESPLAEAARATLPIHAGPELSVAATKTFACSLVAGLWLLAEIKRDRDLLAALRALPAHLEAATRCDWSEAAEDILARPEGSLYTVGRGPSWAISNEAALKFKETCLIHAESYSSAEVLHGPVSIVGAGFPVIALAAADAAEATVTALADDLAAKGAAAFVTGAGAERARVLPHRRTDHWLLDPVSVVVSFYGMVESIARARGIDPDHPRHLRKVTSTI